MKNLVFLSFFMLLVAISLPIFAHAQEIRTVTPVVDHVYVPDGFDDNDESQIIVAGHLPDLCYKFPRAIFEIRDNTITISVKALRLVNPTALCPLLEVPFLATVSVGILKRGYYAIVVNPGTLFEIRERIKIHGATVSTKDDFVYAGVDSVSFSVGTRNITLNGFIPTDCLELDRLEIKNNKDDTYAILPIMVKVRDRCPLKLIPFVHTFTLPKVLDSNPVLLHVRSMQGKSVNALFFDRNLDD